MIRIEGQTPEDETTIELLINYIQERGVALLVQHGVNFGVLNITQLEARNRTLSEYYPGRGYWPGVYEITIDYEAMV